MKKSFFTAILCLAISITAISQNNIGIGTSVPTDKLQIGEYSNFSDLNLSIKTAGANQYKAGIKLRHYSDAWGWTLLSDETTSSFKILRHLDNVPGNAALTISGFDGSFYFDGRVGIGGAPASSAALDIQSTTGALLMPRLTTLQRNALNPTPGMIIFNTDSLKFQGSHQTGHPEGEVLDANNTQSNNEILCSIYDSIAQSFTIIETGSLNRVEVYVEEVPPFSDGTFTFKIRNGNSDTGPILSVNTGINIDTAGLLSITLNTPVPVMAGQQYTFQLSTIESAAVVVFFLHDLDPYSGGHFWRNTLPFTPYDLKFNVYVIIPNTIEYPWYNLSPNY